MDIREAIKRAKTLQKAIETSEEKASARTDEITKVPNWLDKLSDSEKEIFVERAAIMEFDGGLEREQAELEAIKRIIKERIILGKCDKCEG
jgi:glycerol-3-phosphate responsive antiterminator